MIFQSARPIPSRCLCASTRAHSLIIEYTTYNSVVCSSLLKWFLMLSTFMCLLIYYRRDPLKGGFFLVLSLIGAVPLISINGQVWYSYYICLLYLSGVFVLLVYFCSLGGMGHTRHPLTFLVLVMTTLVGVTVLGGREEFIPSVHNLYSPESVGNLGVVFGGLLLFMNFTSYFLSLKGALRRV